MSAAHKTEVRCKKTGRNRQDNINPITSYNFFLCYIFLVNVVVRGVNDRLHHTVCCLSTVNNCNTFLYIIMLPLSF